MGRNGTGNNYESESCSVVTVRPDKSKCPSLEQRRVYCGAKQGEQGALCSKDWNSQIISREEIWSEGSRMGDFSSDGLVVR